MSTLFQLQLTLLVFCRTLKTSQTLTGPLRRQKKSLQEYVPKNHSAAFPFTCPLKGTGDLYVDWGITAISPRLSSTDLFPVSLDNAGCFLHSPSLLLPGMSRLSLLTHCCRGAVFPLSAARGQYFESYWAALIISRKLLLFLLYLHSWACWKVPTKSIYRSDVFNSISAFWEPSILLFKEKPLQSGWPAKE